MTWKWGRQEDRPSVEEAVHQKTAEEVERLDRDDQAQDIALKNKYACWAYVVVSIQLGLANAVFIGYAFAVSWELPTTAISAWLAATVVETLGIVAIISRYLFPAGGRSPARRVTE